MPQAELHASLGTTGSAVYRGVGHLGCRRARTMPLDLQRLAHDVTRDRPRDLGTTLPVLDHDRDGVSGLAVGRKADEESVIALEPGDLQPFAVFRAQRSLRGSHPPYL